MATQSKLISPNHLFINKFGLAPDFDTADAEVDIWDGAADNTAWELMDYVYSTTADIDSISSSAVADTEIMEIQGLDANYDLVVQNATLNGRTRVALTTALIRVFRVKNIGTSDLTGLVFVYPDTPLTDGVPTLNSKIRAIVSLGNNQTEMAIYTIPAGYTGYLRSWYANTAGASKDTNYIIKLFAKTFGQVFQLKHRSSLADVGSSHIQHLYQDALKFTEKTDVRMTVEMTAVGATAGAVSAGFNIVLIED